VKYLRVTAFRKKTTKKQKKTHPQKKNKKEMEICCARCDGNQFLFSQKFAAVERKTISSSNKNSYSSNTASMLSSSPTMTASS
jgi:hypothetical protein